jgi:hypothetical protein
MNINKYIRQLMIELYTPRPPQPPKRPSKIALILKKIIASVRFIIGTTLKTLLLIPIVIFVLVWIYVFTIFLRNRYLVILGEEGTLNLALAGLFVVILIIGVVYVRNEKAFRKALQQVHAKFQKTELHKKLGEWIYVISRLYFYKLLLPNIDLIEPGLTAQQLDGFPETIIYRDEISKTRKHIRKIETNYLVLLPLTILAWVIALIIIPILTTIFTEVINLIPIQAVIKLSDIVGHFFGITWLALFFGSLFAIPAIRGIFTNPSSIITRRLHAIKLEIERLRQDEILQKKLREVEEVSSDVIDDYVGRVKEIRKIFSREIRKLGAAQNELIITQELIERTRALVNNNEDAVRLLLQESQDIQDKRERKKRWKNWTIDIVIGIISALIFKMLFG